MVLDAKAMTWAAQNEIDTAKLKAAKVPIYGKWYFPELPTGVALVNLESGERQTFAGAMLAGEVIWVTERDLRQARLGPYANATDDPADDGATTALAIHKVEPLLAVARPPTELSTVTRVGPPATALAWIGKEGALHATQDPASMAGVSVARGSIAPFVVAIGFCLIFFGLVTGFLFLLVGVVWLLVGAGVWIRVNMLEGGTSSSGTGPLETTSE